jgi:hypothetical protein
MQPAVYVAISAAIISLISLIVAIISCVIAVKNYKKSKRLEFFQRRDQLFQEIADLNAKFSELHIISARFGIVLLNMQSLSISLGPDKRRAEDNTRITTQIASIKKVVQNIELGTSKSDELIKQLHSICSSLTLETDETRIEKLIAMVQVDSAETKRSNELLLSSLHTLESIEPMVKVSIADLQTLENWRAELDLEQAIREFNRSEKVPD